MADNLNTRVPVSVLDERRSFIAAPWHTLSVLLVFTCFSFLDALRAGHAVPENAAAATHAATHAVMIRGYIVSIFYEWGMAYWVWAGVHWKGGTLRDLTGGRWTSWRGVALDVAIAIPFTLSEGRFANLNRRLGMASGVLSLCFGLFVVYQIGFVNGLFGSSPIWVPR